MTSFIQNMIWNSVSPYIEKGKAAVGGYAGDAVIKVGDMVEGGGRKVGNGIENKATGLGSSISGQTHSPSAKALPSTARRPAAHRSNSLPANSKPNKTISKPPTSGVPLGAKKYTNTGANAAKKTTGSVAGGAKSSLGGVTNGVSRGVGGMSKPVGGVVGRANSTTSNLGKGLNGVSKSTSNLGSKPAANTPVKRNNLPKPYPQSSAAQSKAASLPKPYGSQSWAEKKTPVRPGQIKPFNPPQEKKDEEKGGLKPYPGTNTLPGQGTRTPVKKYKAAQRYEPPAKRGEVQHLSF